MDQRAKIGRRLIYFAWGVEVIAAGIGIILAIFIVGTSKDRPFVGG
jgi:hypothetical protein